MKNIRISRRRFLKYGSISSLGISHLLSGSASLLNTLSAYATEPDSLNESDIKLLFSILKQIYPHNVLNDRHYQNVVEKIIEAAVSDDSVNQIINEGINNLNSSVEHTMVKNSWVESSTEEKLEALKKISKTEFFSQLKQKTIVTLYNDPEVWELFGYEGEAFSKGGYINRGFNDLDWLPEPPIKASPRI